jgi:hypothetical protein
MNKSDRYKVTEYMDDFDLVSFKVSSEFQDTVQKVYKQQTNIIKGLLGDIDVYHIGGTSIPGLFFFDVGRFLHGQDIY